MEANPKKILFVDEDAQRSKELSSVLQELNYDLAVVRSASEATGALAKGKVDLVLAAAEGAPKGFDLCKAIREKGNQKNVAIVILSASADADAQFNRHQKGSSRANGYVKCPSPPEDVVDWIERLIGLPPPPVNGQLAATSSFLAPEDDIQIPILDEKLQQEVESLRRTNDELREQINFYERQLAQVSIKEEKESHEMDQVLTDLQKDLEKARKEKDQIREELQLLKTDLGKKDKELKEREKLLGEAKEEKAQEVSDIRHTLEELRKTSEENEEKHKKAQNALREYYKPKLANLQKAEKTISVLEDELVKLSSESKEFKEKALHAEKEIRAAKEEAAREREKTQRIRETLEKTLKAIE